MSYIRWPLPSKGVSLSTLVSQLHEWFRGNDASLVGGDRAHNALDSTDTLVTGMSGDATIADKTAGVIAATYAIEWMETFDVVPSDWILVSGALAAQPVATGMTGGSALRQTGTVTIAFPWKVPYDASKLHRFRARAKRVSGTGTITFGVQCLNAAGAVIATASCGVAAALPNAGSYGAEWTGWVKGLGTFSGASTAGSAPALMPVGTVWIRPYVTINGGDASGVTDVDYLAYDRLDEDLSNRGYNALIHPSDPRYGTGARLTIDGIDTGALQNNAVQNPKIGDDQVDTRTIAPDVSIVGRLENVGGTEWIDLRSGLAPGTIIVQLPGYTADNSGNGSYSGNLDASQITTGNLAAARITAALGSFVSLAAMNATLGIVTTGKVQSGGGTYYIDFGAGSAVTVNLPGFVVSAGNATFSGALSAASGTFAGSLSAADAQVENDLSIGTISTAATKARWFGTVLTGGFSGVNTLLTIQQKAAPGSTGDPDVKIAALRGLFISGSPIQVAATTGTTLGFFGAGGSTQPTVTGSRGGNAALASLLTALANMGLIVDSST